MANMTRRQLRHMISEAMGLRGDAALAQEQTERTFSIRLVTPGPAYYMGTKQLGASVVAAINTLVDDDQTGVTNAVLLARIAQGMGADFILDENLAEEDPELYRPIPVEEYIRMIGQYQY